MAAVDVVVVSYNAREHLRRALEALRRAEGVRPRVLVVDNGSTDGSRELVLEGFPEATLIASDANLGLAGGCNLGIARTATEYVCCMNEDLELEPSALRTLMDYLDAHPQVGVVGPQLRNTDGSLQPSGHPLPTVPRLLNQRYRLRERLGGERYRETGRNYDEPSRVGEVAGACILIRRSATAPLGFFDDLNFWVNWEDVDLCTRVAKAGYEVHFVGTARAVHHWGISGATNQIAVSRHARIGALRYFRKHHGRWPAFLLAAGMLPGDLLAVIRHALGAPSSAVARRRLRLALLILRTTWAYQETRVRRAL